MNTRTLFGARRALALALLGSGLDLPCTHAQLLLVRTAAKIVAQSRCCNAVVVVMGLIVCTWVSLRLHRAYRYSASQTSGVLPVEWLGSDPVNHMHLERFECSGCQLTPPLPAWGSVVHAGELVYMFLRCRLGKPSCSWARLGSALSHLVHAHVPLCYGLHGLMVRSVFPLPLDVARICRPSPVRLKSSLTNGAYTLLHRRPLAAAAPGPQLQYADLGPDALGVVQPGQAHGEPKGQVMPRGYMWPCPDVHVETQAARSLASQGPGNR